MVILVMTDGAELEAVVHRGEKLEFFHADIDRPHTQISEPSLVGGRRVASLLDFTAMNLKAGGDRCELRDSFDLRLIEERGNVTVEDAFGYLRQRFNHPRPR
jgi:hypothetical protein